jgi:ABC-2 type transport system permease protein
MRWAAWTICKREIKSLFVSPIAYLVLGLFALASGILFRMAMEQFDRFLRDPQIQMQLAQNPDFLNLININSFLVINVTQVTFTLLLIVIPFFTMRLLTEERVNHTYELLKTSPLSNWDIVLGKFMAASFFLILCLLTHGIFLVLMFIYGDPEVLPIFSAYLGLFLSGLCFMAVGLFASAITHHQIIALLISFAINVGLVVVSWAANNTYDRLANFLQKSSITFHYEQFNQGIIQVSSLVYFASLLILFLAAGRIAVQAASRA